MALLQRRVDATTGDARGHTQQVQPEKKKKYGCPAVEISYSKSSSNVEYKSQCRPAPLFSTLISSKVCSTCELTRRERDTE